jgi:preprotein translocase subunit Sss1
MPALILASIIIIGLIGFLWPSAGFAIVCAVVFLIALIRICTA